MALLALAEVAGCQVPGQADAIEYAAQWLLSRRVPGTAQWPAYVAAGEPGGVIEIPVRGRNDAWCYGAPGIGHALSLAGRAIASPAIASAGAQAIGALAERGPEHWDTAGSALCHGFAGVLQCASPSHPAVASQAATAVLEAMIPIHASATCRHDPGGVPLPPGLLTGVAGIVLALADHLGVPAPAVPAEWRCLLLLA